MTRSNELENKIRTYLSSLSPKALESLVRKLEKSKRRQSSDPHLDLILAAAAALVRGPQPTAVDAPGGDLRRERVHELFFSPLNDFLIDEALPTRQEGRIHRPMLDRVWKWLARDVMPNEVKTVLDQAGNATVSGERVDALIQALRTRAVDALGEALEASEVSEKKRRIIGVELGGERGIAELKDIQKVFAAERWLLPFLKNIPERINEHRLKKDHDVLRLVDKCSNRFPDHVPIIAAALVERSETPSALCTFAGRLAGDEDPRTIAGSQFAPFVDIVMSEAERLQIRALDDRHNNDDPGAFSEALSDYHALVRGVERDMDLSLTGRWHQRLADTKRNISGEVTRELKGASGAIRRALQVPKFDRDGVLKVDQTAIDDAVRTLRVVTMARTASETFAVNEIGKQTRQAVEQTLEIVTRSLITDLGKAEGAQVEAHASAADVAVKLSEIYFGTDYAAQLRRSREAAFAKATNQETKSAPAPERKLVSSVLARY